MNQPPNKEASTKRQLIDWIRSAMASNKFGPGIMADLDLRLNALDLADKANLLINAPLVFGDNPSLDEHILQTLFEKSSFGVHANADIETGKGPKAEKVSGNPICDIEKGIAERCGLDDSNQTTNARTSAAGAVNQEDSKTAVEDPWYTPNERWPGREQFVEFETRFGERHVGKTVILASEHRSNLLGEALFKSENTDQPLYFTRQQIAKWRAAPPLAIRRYRGAIDMFSEADVSPVVMMFVVYLNERYYDKYKSNKGYHRPPQNHPTKAWTEPDGKSSWETTVSFNNGSVAVFKHYEGEDHVVVEIKPLIGESTIHFFNFKQVMECAELALDHCIND